MYIPKKKYQTKAERNDAKILAEFMKTKYDANQIRVMELMVEMDLTAQKIQQSVFELKKSALIINAPDKIDCKKGIKRGSYKKNKE